MLSELRHAVRTLRRSPLFALGAVLTLALGIGANAAVFSVVDAVLLRPLRYAEPDRLVRIWETNPALGIERGDVSPGSFVDWRTRTRTLDRISVFMAREWLLSIEGAVEAVQGAEVSPSLFPMLGVAPVAGRTFRPEAEQAPPFGDEGEIVISHALWQRRYGGRMDALGRTIWLEGRLPLTIVGVMPAGFAFPARAEAWRSETFLRPVGPGQRMTRYYEAIGQLRHGSTIDDARSDLGAIAKGLETEHPRSNAGYGVRIERLDETIVGGVRTGLALLLAVVACVLLIACANVASLVLARATARRHEVAVRLALGASWARVLRQSLTESAVLAALGAAVGCLVGRASVQVLVALAPGDIPRLDEITFGGPVLLCSAGVGLVSAIVTGLPPVFQARRLDVHDTLKTGGRGGAPAATRSARTWLIAGEVALTLVLLIGSMLLLRSFIALRGVDVGFDSRQVLTAELRLATNRFPDTGRPWFLLARHYDDALSDLAAIPGVAAVGGITGLPLAGNASSATFWIGTGAGPRPDATQQFKADISVVTPQYFDVLRIPLRRGRTFTAADRLSEQTLTQPPAESLARPHGVVVINDAAARRFWPGADPIGASIVLFDHPQVAASTIVGVVGDVRASGVAMPGDPAVYVPFGELPGFRLAIAVRTEGSPQAVTGRVRDRLRQIDPQMLVSRIRPMDDVVGGAVSRPRFTLVLVGSFALLALSLAAVGIYSVVAFLVAGRTREIGVRMALGAERADVVRLVLTDGLVPVALGSIAGFGLALLGVRALGTLLFGVLPLDPISFLGAASALGAVALAAALIPARRAAGVDPLIALRQE
jgi:predicted permease